MLIPTSTLTPIPTPTLTPMLTLIPTSTTTPTLMIMCTPMIIPMTTATTLALPSRTPRRIWTVVRGRPGSRWRGCRNAVW